MSNPLVSVVIPVYNLASYLPKCIESVLGQGIDALEIVAVDDGSTDNSRDVMQEYAEKDNRIKLIFKGNDGVSSGRNAGIEKASGEYLFFLDGDDWLEDGALGKLLQYAKDYDIVQGTYVNTDSTGHEELDVDPIDSDFEGYDEIIGAYFLHQIHESCCNKLYKRALIGDTRFDTALEVAEDSKFVYNLLKKAQRVKTVADTTYHYFVRENSCTRQQLAEKHFDPLKLRDMQFGEIGDNKSLRDKLIYSDSKLTFFVIRQILQDESGKFRDRLPALRARVMKYKQNVFFSKHIGARFKIGAVLLWLFPKLFYKIYSK